MLTVKSRNFDLNLLKSLDALLSEKNVTRAARLVHVSQSTMSGIFRRLREEFDDPLLVRHGRGYELSPLAQTLSVSVRHVLLQVDAMMSSRTLFDPATDTRSFRIMVSDYATMVFLSKVFQDTERLAPYLSYEIIPISSPIEHVLGGSVDMCIVDDETYEGESHPHLRSDILFSDAFCFVVDRDHPLTGTAALDDIREHPQVLTTFSGVETPASVLRIVERRRIGRPNISVSGFSMIPSLVLGTTAIGILPCRMLSVTAPNIRRLEVDFEMPSFAKQLVWHSRFDYDPAFCWLRNIMLDCALQLSRSAS